MSASVSKAPPSGNFSCKLLKARRWFFKMSLREKALLLLFVAVVLAMWGSLQLSRHASVQEAIGQAHFEAERQEDWLAEQPRIDQQYAALVAELNLEELPSKDEVSSQIDAMVRRYGFPFDLGQARTEQGVNLAFHTIPLKIDRVTFPDLKRFTNELKTQLPYVSLERISIQPLARDDRFVEASFLLKSIEYTK